MSQSNYRTKYSTPLPYTGIQSKPESQQRDGSVRRNQTVSERRLEQALNADQDFQANTRLGRIAHRSRERHRRSEADYDDNEIIAEPVRQPSQRGILRENYIAFHPSSTRSRNDSVSEIDQLSRQASRISTQSHDTREHDRSSNKSSNETIDDSYFDQRPSRSRCRTNVSSTDPSVQQTMITDLLLPYKRSKRFKSNKDLQALIRELEQTSSSGSSGSDLFSSPSDTLSSELSSSESIGVSPSKTPIHVQNDRYVLQPLPRHQSQTPRTGSRQQHETQLRGIVSSPKPRVWIDEQSPDEIYQASPKLMQRGTAPRGTHNDRNQQSAMDTQSSQHRSSSRRFPSLEGLRDAAEDSNHIVTATEPEPEKLTFHMYQTPTNMPEEHLTPKISRAGQTESPAVIGGYTEYVDPFIKPSDQAQRTISRKDSSRQLSRRPSTLNGHASPFSQNPSSLDEELIQLSRNASRTEQDSIRDRGRTTTTQTTQTTQATKSYRPQSRERYHDQDHPPNESQISFPTIPRKASFTAHQPEQSFNSPDIHPPHRSSLQYQDPYNNLRQRLSETSIQPRSLTRRATSQPPKPKTAPRTHFFELVDGVKLDTMPKATPQRRTGLSLPEIEARDVRQIPDNSFVENLPAHDSYSENLHFADPPPPIGLTQPRTISPRSVKERETVTFIDNYSRASIEERDDSARNRHHMLPTIPSASNIHDDFVDAAEPPDIAMGRPESVLGESRRRRASSLVKVVVGKVLKGRQESRSVSMSAPRRSLVVQGLESDDGSDEIERRAWSREDRSDSISSWSSESRCSVSTVILAEQDRTRNSQDI